MSQLLYLTGIGALVAGVSFAFMKMNIYQFVIVIAIITFLSSMIGTQFGKKLEVILEKEWRLQEV